MASNTRPFLMTGAALASAAAVVVATPVIAPTVTAAQMSVSEASVSLATFSDLLSIPADEWVTAFFQGYGGVVGPNNPQPGNPSETGGLEPWASGCNGGCFIAGPSGVAYLALDALISGDGTGWNPPNEGWSIGALNYLFEGGTFGAGADWILQESVGAANPILAVAITLLFTGPQLFTVVFDNAVQLLGDAALNVPIVGQYIAGALNAYLGPASLYPDFQVYTAGLSGVLNYALDVLSGGAPVIPPPSAAAATLAAVPAAAAATLATRAVEAAATPAAEAVETAPATADSVAATPSVAADKSAAAEAGAESTAADATAEAEADATAGSTEAGATEATDATEATAADTTAADVKPETGSAGADAAPATKPAESAASPRKRPLRDAVEKVATSIGSALKGTKAGAKANADAAEKPAAAADSAS